MCDMRTLTDNDRPLKSDIHCVWTVLKLGNFKSSNIDVTLLYIIVLRVAAAAARYMDTR